MAELVVALTVACSVQSHNWTEQPELKPPHDKLPEPVAFNVTAKETADIGIPPRYALIDIDSPERKM